MKRTQIVVATFVLIFALLSTVNGQNTQAPQTRATPEDERLRITTNLVQVDVVVTDKDGNQVTDLRPEEFEVLEDGKRQPITNFSYVSAANQTTSGSNVTTAAAGSETATTVPPVPLRPGQVRRTLSLVVDDLGISFESINFVRKALRQFIDEQMQPGDLVAIFRTSGGAGALQQFTTDKRLLYAAIDSIRWLPRGRGDITPFDSSINPSGDMLTDSYTREALADLQSSRNEILGAGTIGTLNLILRALGNLPGRKSVILFTENVQILDATGNRSERLAQAMKQLADYSNRASAVVYTVDTSGLQTLTPGAAVGTNNARVNSDSLGNMQSVSQSRNPSAGGDRTTVGNPEENLRALDNLTNARRSTYFESQGVLKTLAELTGGVAIRNTNDIAGAVRKVFEEQKGYYLIGYRPDEIPVDTRTGERRPLKVSVKVKRPNLKVRARSNFYGVAEEVKPAEARTQDQQLIAALNSPFAGDVRIRLTSLFGDQSSGSFVRAMVYVDARDLKFSDEAGGSHKASLDIVVLTLDANGRIVDQGRRTETITAKGDAYKRMLETGLTYMLNVPVKQPGGYQVRVAVRDAATGGTGSAGQYIGVPDLARGGLTLSGITMNGISLAAATQNVQEEQNPQAGPAVRRLAQGMVLEYGYTIYNATLDKATNKPQVTTQMRLFRDGKPVFTGRVSPLDLTGQTDMKRLEAGGRLQVGTELSPGDYVLQVIVTDTLIKEKDKRRTATQWIDFEVVR